MTAVNSRSASDPRFAWVLWLALILPLAQFAANWHAQSHWDVERTGQLEDKSLGVDPCDLCLTAAALAAGGAATEAPLLALAPHVQAAPQTNAGGIWVAPAALAYESRAPPSTLR